MTEMVMAGLVNINTDSGRFYDVADALREIDEVKEIWGAYGDIDLIAWVETRGEYLSEVIVKKVQSIPGVTKTSTTILIPLKKKEEE